jgi:hypothetical protein
MISLTWQFDAQSPLVYLATHQMDPALHFRPQHLSSLFLLFFLAWACNDCSLLRQHKVKPGRRRRGKEIKEERKRIE